MALKDWIEKQMIETSKHYIKDDTEHNEKIDLIIKTYIHVLCYIDPEYKWTKEKK